jgi:hypothetical protein
MSFSEVVSLNMFISYSQIALFDGSLRLPFNNWAKRHVAQGFTWRDGSISFRTLIESGPIDVTVVRLKQFLGAEGVVRAISVPFSCGKDSRPEIASITESRRIDLDPGAYQVVFETGWLGEACWCRFSIIRDGDLRPEILVRDGELNPSFPLLMEAEPAE